MGSVIFLVVSLALLIAVAVAFFWQERRKTPGTEVVYGVEEALEFVMSRLSPAARETVNRHDVRRILEWELLYLQDPSLRGDDLAVVGGIDAALFAQEQALAQGYSYDGDVIIEIVDLQADYLEEIGAVAGPVSAEEGEDIIERYEEQT